MLRKLFFSQIDEKIGEKSHASDARSRLYGQNLKYRTNYNYGYLDLRSTETAPQGVIGGGGGTESAWSPQRGHRLIYRGHIWGVWDKT